MAKPTLDDLIRADLASGWLTAEPDSGSVRHDGRPELQGHRYLRARLSDGRYALAHRVVWIAAHGSVPDGRQVDHKNGDRRDNRIANLQAVTGAVNSGRYARREHLDFIRPSDLARVDPHIVDRARALAASGATRTEVADFLWRVRNMGAVGV